MRKSVDSRSVLFIILTSCIVAMISFGARSGFGLYLEPITSTHGWGREIFSVAIGLQNIMWGIGQPIAGALADRFGTTRVLIGGALIYALGLVLMAFSIEPWMLHFSAGILVGIGGAGASFGLVMAAVGKLVPDDNRSWALGVVVASTSLGQFLFSFLNFGFISAFGWQNALVLLALLVLLILPLAMAFRGAPVGAAAGAQTLGQAIREATQHRSYVLLVAGFFVCGYHVAFIQTHLPPYIKDVGVEPWVAAASIAFVGLFNIIGSYSAGVMGGKWSKKYLLSFIYFGRSVVIFLFILFPPTTVTTLVFSAAMGLLWLSTVPLTSGLVAMMFGPRYMATLFGIVFLSHQVGALLGVWLGGWSFDTTGSYTFVWATMIAMGILAGVIHLPIVEKPVTRLQPQPA